MEWEKDWFQELYDNLKGLYESENEEEIFSLRELVHIELGLFLLNSLKEKDPRGLWFILSGYYQYDSNPDLNHKIANARILLPKYSSRQQWLDILDWYSGLNSRWRLFKITRIEQDEKLLFSFSLCNQTCFLYQMRCEVYENTLISILPVRSRNISAATKGTYYYIFKGQPQPITFPEINIPRKNNDTLWKKINQPLNHRQLDIPIEELKQCAKEMNEKDPQSNWLDRYIQLEIKTKELKKADKLEIKDIIHIVGIVGSGKSTLVDIIAYWCSKNQKRIAIVLETVADILNKVELFNKLNISCIPIIGKSNRKQHRYALEKRIKKDKSSSKSATQGFPFIFNSGYSWLSPLCLLNSFLDKERRIKEGYEPCLVLKDDKKKTYSCPFLEACPRYESQLNLFSSQVWLLTTSSLLMTKLIPHVDEYERTFLEFVYLEADLVIMDEVDRVQLQLDQIFAPERMLTGEKDKKSLDVIASLVNQQNTVTGRRSFSNNVVSNWNRMLNDCQKVLGMLMNHIIRSPEIHKKMTSTYINPVMCFKDLEELLKDTRLLKELDLFVNDKRSALINTIKQDSIYSVEQNENLLIKEIMRVQKDKNSEEFSTLFQKVKFLLLLKEMDRNLYLLMKLWNESIEETYNLDLEPSDFFSNIPKFYLSIIPHPPLGRFLGYRLQPIQERGGNLKVLLFSGLGRYLLYNFPHLFSHVFHQEGPPLIILSATSWMPLSTNYHIDLDPTYILDPPKVFSKVIRESQAFFRPLRFENEPIWISGSKLSKRDENVQKTGKSLSQQISKESVIDKISERTPGKRGILLIVGSYKEGRMLLKSIINTRPDLTNRILCLVSEKESVHNIDSQRLLPRGLIHQFAGMNADILIAPMKVVQRGHNILTRDGIAALGSVLFLVRPMPHPEDTTNLIQKINQWAMTRMNNLSMITNTTFYDAGVSFRQEAGKFWHAILKRPFSYVGMKKNQRNELLSNNFILIWQIVGRLLRGKVSAKIYFMDAAFAPNTAKLNNIVDTEDTSMLIGIQKLMNELLSREGEGRILSLLYGDFNNCIQKLEWN